jgi:P pilus assembly chaperone PapD
MKYLKVFVFSFLLFVLINMNVLASIKEKVMVTNLNVLYKRNYSEVSFYLKNNTAQDIYVKEAKITIKDSEENIISEETIKVDSNITNLKKITYKVNLDLTNFNDFTYEIKN